jgi:hypothetical protein
MRRKVSAAPIRTALVLVAAVAATAVALLASTSASAVQASPSPPIPPNAVLTWNTYAVNAVRASSPSKFQVEGLIYMSYVQASVYDAVTKLEGGYQPYHDFTYTVVAGTSAQAAVAAAAQTALDNYLPDQAATVDSEYNAYITSLGGLGAPGVSDGVALGQAAANDIIALRSGDGRNAATPTYGTIGPIIPGEWQLQSAAQTAQTPWVATMRPFVLQQASQFRVGPPPALTSQQYAKDLNEVEAYGGSNSTVRTQDETNTAYFWNANAVNQYNGMMQNAITENGMDLTDAAHMFAMGELTTADAGIACWDSKYRYLSWRPITAIQHADLDGNDATTADPSWTPLLPTPAHPEYPSAHGCLTSALTDALAAALGSNNLNITVPGATNGGTTLTTSRVFNNVQNIQNEVVNARVWIGFHFRNSVVQGEKLGNDVARYDLSQAFQPAP